MEGRFSTFILILAVILVVMGVGIWLAIGPGEEDVPGDGIEKIHLSRKGTPSDLGKGQFPGDRLLAGARDAMDDFIKLADLEKLLSDKNALKGEAVLRFNSKEAYDAFLEAAAKFGLNILGEHSRANALRIGFDDLADLHSALGGVKTGDYEVGANYAVYIPGVPDPGTPENPGQQVLPFGNRTLEWLGIPAGLNADWGKGITIAILDTGIDPHSTFGPGRVTAIDFLDAGSTAGDVYGHGTAVASLAAGNGDRAGGVAPAANILSYAVTNAEGVSDSFTLSQAIFDAVDRGANVINISLGSYGDSFVMREAVTYALGKGVAIVAAAGNEGTSNLLTYPAGYKGVISAGAVDALGQHVYYSNASSRLSLSAPGVGVVAAWPGDKLVTFSGTSASAPYVSGAVAAILSQNPGISALQAEELLYQYANEAGRPGADPEFGNGILNVGRIMERHLPGIYDVAVASMTFANPAVPTNNANPMIDVAVQNRGTETLYNLQVQVNATGMVRYFQIPSLRPGEVDVRAAPVDAIRTRVDGSTEVLSTVTFSDTSLQDRNLRDNQSSMTVSVKEGE